MIIISALARLAKCVLDLSGINGWAGHAADELRAGVDQDDIITYAHFICKHH